jgi:hypothetical protein
MAMFVEGVFSSICAKRGNGVEREMGIRMALGATPGPLSAFDGRDGLRLSLVGVAISDTSRAASRRANRRWRGDV